MTPPDPTDRRLLSLLQQDARMPVVALAAELGISRATVSARIERLRASGAIRRFTVELGAPDADDMVRAVMLIELQGPQARGVAARLRRMRQVSELHSTNGAWDLVARIEVASLAEFDQVLNDIREIPGVLNSETCLLLGRAGG
ncbi:DNA-binding Lrp family transcriptional regulator [Limimaricola variabilis]|jgi:DNA-binding Lrp family transcriptional regulator|uniref:DNA-binding Lrp family transcriptional regulator n=1 Tax=Limimaricola variabilis TaxID=1492771 RepID=A0ABR6HN88_9RHOB|nr:Lrp/AsnC family transcriptional regulator [Limimaricola variabilis]MBB3711913.1 DNA-binding Lrp family transcriptional regulator [Limimaricola variabilis]WPY96694.1 Lrp/AsnC family transcriptional regulator [Limimaricola variabilis]